MAASCLLPITTQLVEQLPTELPRVLAVLWTCLGDMKDDLNSSVGAVMDLLGESFYTCIESGVLTYFYQDNWSAIRKSFRFLQTHKPRQCLLRTFCQLSLADYDVSQSLNTLAPTLFSFFRHTITSVRLAVVKTLHSFLSVPTLPKEWIAPDFLRLVIQNLVVEERTDIRNATMEL